jgi:hypothetical protein
MIPSANEAHISGILFKNLISHLGASSRAMQKSYIQSPIQAIGQT